MTTDEKQSDAEKKRRDFWAAVEPWYEPLRAAYYLIGIISALGFGTVYIVRTIIVPHWDSIASLVFVFANFSGVYLFARMLDRSVFINTYLKVALSFPVVTTGIACHAILKIIDLPADDAKLWRECFTMAMFDTVFFFIGLMLQLCGQLFRTFFLYYEGLDRSLTHSESIVEIVRALVEEVRELKGLPPIAKTDQELLD